MVYYKKYMKYKRKYLDLSQQSGGGDPLPTDTANVTVDKSVGSYISQQEGVPVEVPEQPREKKLVLDVHLIQVQDDSNNMNTFTYNSYDKIDREFMIDTSPEPEDIDRFIDDMNIKLSETGCLCEWSKWESIFNNTDGYYNGKERDLYKNKKYQIFNKDNLDVILTNMNKLYDSMLGLPPVPEGFKIKIGDGAIPMGAEMEIIEDANWFNSRKPNLNNFTGYYSQNSSVTPQRWNRFTYS